MFGEIFSPCPYGSQIISYLALILSAMLEKLNRVSLAESDPSFLRKGEALGRVALTGSRWRAGPQM